MAKVSHKMLTLAGCLGFFSSGLAISLVGVSLEFFATRLGTDITGIGGGFFLAIGCASFPMLFAAGPLIDRFGKKPVLTAGCLLAALSMPLLLTAGSLGGAVLAMFILGAGAGMLSGAINTLVNDDLFPEDPGPPLNLMNLFFGIGALSLPFAASRLLERPGLPVLILCIAASCALSALLFAIGTYPPPREGTRFRLADSRRALADPLVLMMAAGLFLYVGLEASLGAWSRPAMIDNWKVEASGGQLILAGYWGALVVGRALAGTLLKRVNSQTLVVWSSTAACLGLAAFAVAPTFPVACGGLWFCGLCFAPIFPSSLGAAGHVFKHYTGTIFSTVIAAGVLGQTIIPLVVGRVARASSFNRGLWVALCLCLLLAALQYAVSGTLRRRAARAT